MSSCCPTSQTATSCCADHPASKLPIDFSVVLVGNPNCGKTTLFNALTGARQKIGNWPGVTVEKKCGTFNQLDQVIEVVDLPGIYSLMLASETSAIDERIASEFIVQQQAALIVNIVDASNLERHLYLTTQLLEMGVPIILALNMMDVARARGLHIDSAKLARELGCPVIALEANKGGGIVELKHAIASYSSTQARAKFAEYPAALRAAQQHVASLLRTTAAHTTQADWQALRLLEGDMQVASLATPAVLAQLQLQQKHLHSILAEDADILIADARYQLIQRIIETVVVRPTTVQKTWTQRIDNIVLNRIFGIPIFLSMMYLLFVFAINIGGAFQDFFDMTTQAIFVDGFAKVLSACGTPMWLTALLANGAGKGINTTVTFIPVIGSMFLFLALLEDSGYMARAAFVIDRAMRALGLPGKAFVPMIVGFGCNVPAVMGARTLENKRDRILTIMMTPFMSCGARLAIFAVFTAAFFPRGGQNVVFALYIIGIAMAVLTGFLLRRTVLKGEPSPLIMELPLYHVPHVKTILLHACQRLKGFVFRAGKLIVPICILIGALNALNLDGSLNTGEGDTRSLLSLVGQWVTPIFSPMGLHADNWPATVGLVTGVLAKEVVIGTLNTLYSQVGHFAGAVGNSDFHFWTTIGQAFQSIPENLSQLGDAFSNPVLAQAPMGTVNQGVYGLMYQRFDGQVGAFAYLLFVLLYFPCISTMAAMLRELHRGWAIFSGLWMTAVAYGVAVVFYQAATYARHPISSASWVLGVVSIFALTIACIRWFAGRETVRRVSGLSTSTVGGQQ